MSKTIHVTVVSDFMCPWCYVGAERLEKALGQLRASGYEVSVQWNCFLIESRIPPGGMGFADYMEQRWGSRDPFWLREVEESASHDGIPLRWNDVALDSFEAHMASMYVKHTCPEREHEFHMALLRAYYGENKNISLKDVIKSVADAVGLPGDEIVRQDKYTRQSVIDEYKRQKGISGVPDITYEYEGRTTRTHGACDARRILSQLATILK